MSLPSRVVPHLTHKVTAVVLLLTALALLGQVSMFYSLSDEQILKVVTFQLGKQPGASAERVASFVSDNQDTIVSTFRSAEKPWIPKSLGALIALAVAAGLLQGKPSPTRLLAGIAAAAGGLGFFVNLSSMGDNFAIAQHLGGLPFLIDGSFSVLLPLAVLLCLIVAGSGTWKLAAAAEAPAGPAA